MNRLVIADSSALFSLFIETDINHLKALKISKLSVEMAEIVIIPGEVFSELINTIGKKLNHKTATKAAQFIIKSGNFRIEYPTENTIYKALGIFLRQPRSVSYTDCIVMAFADHFESKEIFGFDEAFHKNGYRLPV